jgi:hypothetical protein
MTDWALVAAAAGAVGGVILALGRGLGELFWRQDLRTRRRVPPAYTHTDLRRDLDGDVPLDDILEKCGGRFPPRRRP